MALQATVSLADITTECPECFTASTIILQGLESTIQAVSGPLFERARSTAHRVYILTKVNKYMYGSNLVEMKYILSESIRVCPPLEEDGSFWVFGYGSLIWNPGNVIGASSVEDEWGYISGWQRRFWQGSPDHRGTPSSLGRVVTLVQLPGNVWGRAFRIAPDHVGHVLGYLVIREQGGYAEEFVDIHLSNDRTVRGISFRATETNAWFLGDASPESIASQISQSVGPSGTNVEYLMKLVDAIESRGLEDEHLRKLKTLVLHNQQVNDT